MIARHALFIIIISCHHTDFFHLSAHRFPRLLNIRRLSRVQGCVMSVHCNICPVFSVASPHSYVVSQLYYPPFFLCYLLQEVYPVRRAFRHIHVSQGLPCTLAKSFGRCVIPSCDLWRRLIYHALHPTTLEGKCNGCTLVRKHFLDFRRLMAGM